MFKSSEEKETAKLKKFLEKYNLEGVDPKYLKSVQDIGADMSSAGLFKAGMALSFAKAEEQAKLSYFSTLVKQNWVIIKELDDIAKKLDK